MVCPHCGATVAKGVGQCPACTQPIFDPNPSRRHHTATDVIEGILFIAIGLVLMLVSVLQLLQNAGPAIQAIQGVPQVSSAWQATSVAGSRLYTLPVILTAVSNLMWAVSGLFLVIAGLLSLFAAKGLPQGRAGVTFMLFGLAADVITLVILVYEPIENFGFSQKMLAIVQVSWWRYLIEIVAIVVTSILLSMKRRAQKRVKLDKMRQQTQALAAARAQAQMQADTDAQAQAQATQQPQAGAPPQNPQA